MTSQVNNTLNLLNTSGILTFKDQITAAVICADSENLNTLLGNNGSDDDKIQLIANSRHKYLNAIIRTDQRLIRLATCHPALAALQLGINDPSTDNRMHTMLTLGSHHRRLGKLYELPLQNLTNLLLATFKDLATNNETLSFDTDPKELLNTAHNHLLTFILGLEQSDNSTEENAIISEFRQMLLQHAPTAPAGLTISTDESDYTDSHHPSRP